MDIKEKLRQLDALSLKKDSVQRQPKSVNRCNVEECLNAVKNSNPYGDCYLVEKELAENYLHGDVSLASLLRRQAAYLPIVGKDQRLASIDLSRLLFIDTETTGLSGGTGTCAFLIGVGFFEGSTFKVKQFFMSDFHEEAAMLYEINQLLPRFDCLVSYNGKSFDLPLLVSRNIYQGFQTSLPAVRHFDLLHSVRRLWKHRLRECTLLNAEQHLTHLTRTAEDIPGFLIPQTYFTFLKNKDARPLKPIFYHNQQDIVAMAALLNITLSTIERPIDTCNHPADILAVGRLFESLKRYEDSAALYRDYLSRSDSRLYRKRILFQLAHNFKKLQRWREAAEVWQESLASESFHPLPYIELAKHYEHKERNPEKAQELVQKALSELSILEQLTIKPEWREYHKDLRHRAKRLQNKAVR